MCSQSERGCCCCCLLRCRIDDSLRAYAPHGAASSTNEKYVLVALSQISEQIHLWKHEPLKQRTMSEPACSAKLSSVGDHHCLSLIVADLMVLLAAESQFAQHLAGNTMVAVSEFVAASGSKWWSELIHILCLCLEWAVSDIISEYPAPLVTRAEKFSDCDWSRFISVLKSKLKKANWSMTAGVLRILRNIMKNLRKEDNERLLKTYLNSISSCLSSPSWDLMKIPVDILGDGQMASSVNAFAGQQKSVFVFLGNAVQFICSLVDRSGQMEAADVSKYKNDILRKVNNLVPVLLCWCLGKHWDWNDSCTTQYFRHKMLMIMIRLSFQIYLDFSVVSQWLQLMHKYFKDLLWEPFMQSEAFKDKNNFLEGSPFLSTFSDGEVNGTCLRHLQRQAVFLFLKCCFSLINMSKGFNEQCLCTTPTLWFENDIYSNPGCCCKKKGMVELYGWLELQLPTSMFVDNEMLMERCIKFSKSFLQLFISEDDLLFEVLLQLHMVPISPSTKQQICREGNTLRRTKEDNLSVISYLFNPMHLLHLFLSELSYDHQVLLDYLISKDTGISCAEYLLRCLRAICDSMHSFVNFPPSVVVLSQSPHKKFKIDGQNCQLEPSSAISGKEDGILLSLEKNHETVNQHSSKHFMTRSHPFQEAKRCLLMLKESVENLHLKNLFPYNPEVLLRRLTRFQELCVNLEDPHCVWIDD